jgi:TonB-linked SusC/RagA family outer membrane protein
MLRKLLCLIFFSVVFTGFSFAQGTVSGTITDARNGETIPGVNVLITELDRGAATNADGKFEINNVPSGTYTLRASFVGYTTIERDIEVGNEDVTLDLQLKPDLIGMDDVIVTAQNIERQAREIGTSITSVSSEEITRARDANVVNSLSGKVPGIDITSQSGTAGGSSRITIRGNSTLTGNNQPLFVVDGVPVSNSNTVGASSTRLSGGAVDVGNRASDLNPEDIENITVLRGSSAAALYGQRAQNGVILITTKKGQGNLDVSVSSTVRTNEAFRLPDFQNEYAQGDQGTYDAQNLNGWGPKIEGQMVEQFPYDGNTTPLQAHPDNVENFLRNGIETINNVSVAGAGDTGGDFRLSITNTQSEGIVPGNELERTNISLNAGQEFSEKFQTRATANYVDSEGLGRPIQGGNSPNAIIGTLFSFPRTLDTDVLRNNVTTETGEQISLTNQINNPYWITRNNGLNNEVRRFYGSGEFVYSPLEWLSFTGRVGLDYVTDNRDRPTVKGTLGRLDGRYNVDRLSEQQIDANFLIGIDRQITEDITLDATIGGNLNTRRSERFSNQATGLVVDGLNNFGNAENNSPSNNLTQQRLLGAYIDAQVGYKNYLFLNVSGRNDWSSTLPKENRSFFYPSASMSFIFTQALNFGGDILSFGKLRASISEVGSDEAPYQLNFRYFPDQTIFGQFGTDLQFPYNNALAFTATGTRPPSNLKPQRQVSMEVGTELQFFDGRIGVDFTYYNNETRDQIISVPTPLSTGFDFARQNAGTVKNEGIEGILNVTPVRTRDFNWTTTVNFTKNNQTVVSLAEGLDEITIGSGFNGLRIKATVGDELGLFGTGWLRNDQEEVVLDPNTGLRQFGGEVRYGDQSPDYLLGINNSISYKGINFSFLIDIKQGGTIVSGTVQDLFSSGLAQETADLRDQYPDGEFVPEGVVPDGSGGYTENTQSLADYGTDFQTYYETLYDGSVFEEVAYDASFVKLREVKLGYNLPAKWLSTIPISSASVSVEGRNLWLIWSKAPHIDPETNIFGSSSTAQGVEFNNIPNVRSFGASVQLQF